MSGRLSGAPLLPAPIKLRQSSLRPIPPSTVKSMSPKSSSSSAKPVTRFARPTSIDRSVKPVGKRSVKPVGQRSVKPLGQRSVKPLSQRSVKSLGQRSVKPLSQRSVKPSVLRPKHRVRKSPPLDPKYLPVSPQLYPIEGTLDGNPVIEKSPPPLIPRPRIVDSTRQRDVPPKLPPKPQGLPSKPRLVISPTAEMTTTRRSQPTVRRPSTVLAPVPKFRRRN